MSLPCLETTNLKHVCADLTSPVHSLLMWGEKRERCSSCYLFFKKTNLLFSGSNFLLHRLTLLRSMFHTGFCFATLDIKSCFRRVEWEDRGTSHDVSWYRLLRTWVSHFRFCLNTSDKLTLNWTHRKTVQDRLEAPCLRWWRIIALRL